MSAGAGDALIDMSTLTPIPLESAPAVVECPATPTPTRRGVLRLTVDVPVGKPPKDARAAPARWHTPEFYVYYVLAAIVIPAMVWVPWQLSSPDNPDYAAYEWRLSPGWLFGRPVDNSDHQYRGFRNNLPALSGLVALFFAAKAFYTRAAPSRADRVPFYVGIALVVLGILHGTGALKVLALVLANYALTRAGAGRPWFVPALWAWNGAVLFANERWRGYEGAFGALHPGLAFLDTWTGAYPRWHVGFNITMLRLVSFGVDAHWARTRRDAAPEPGQVPPSKARPGSAHPAPAYALAPYVAYALYPPLYLAGPIMTYNDFLWQLKHSVPPARGAVARYALRFGACLLTMEALLHAAHVVAIKESRAWAHAGPAALALVGFWNLIAVWLKLLLPWRAFRLWALADGLDAPENMVRCMADNFSALGFWRAWHRSYNLWIVRYIYVPLGGAKRALPTTLLVFTFVALWHDLSFTLLAWGWLVSLFVLPEAAARALVPPTKYGRAWWFRHAAAAGAVANILMMMGANLVGFVVGLDGARHVFGVLLGSAAGLRFMALACGCIWVAAQLMFEYREEELRQGIYRRC